MAVWARAGCVPVEEAQLDRLLLVADYPVARRAASSLYHWCPNDEQLGRPHSTSRAETQLAFNDEGTQGTVLVTNLRLGATSMNLQKGCSDLVFMELPESGNTAAQGVGRVLRIGQSHEQHIYCYI